MLDMYVLVLCLGYISALYITLYITLCLLLVTRLLRARLIHVPKSVNLALHPPGTIHSGHVGEYVYDSEKKAINLPNQR